MSPVRDFSESVKTTLAGYMKDNGAEEEYWALSFSGDIPAPSYITNQLASYEENIQSFHSKVIDKKNDSKSQLDKIWADVKAVDEEYAVILQAELDQAKEHIKAFAQLANALSPGAASANWAPSIFGSRAGMVDFLDDSQKLEMAMDYDMQEAVFELMKDERFSEEAWNAASLEERKQILQEFFNELQLIMGTNAQPDLIFEIAGKAGKPGGKASEQIDKDDEKFERWAEYSTEHRQVYIMEWILEEEGHDVMRAMVHEARHAYQAESVYGPLGDGQNGQGDPIYREGGHIVSEQTRNQWRHNIENPIFPEDDTEGYRSQANEWDANKFADAGRKGVLPEYQGSWELD